MDTTGILDQVTLQFMQALQQDGVMLQSLAKNLFYSLALIQLTMTALWMGLAGVSLQTLFMRMLQLLLGFSIFYFCLEMGSQWIPLVLNGFVEIGQQSGIKSLSPSSIINQGMSIAGAILKTFFDWGVLAHPYVALIGAIDCIAIIILYALIAAELAIVLVKSYMLTALSSFFFALGANEATRPMTMSYLKVVIGIGLKLMTLYFLLSVGQTLGRHWSELSRDAALANELLPMLAILAGVIIYYMIIKNIPAFIAGLAGVGGFQHEGSTAVALAVNAGMRGSRSISKMGGMTARAAQGISQGAQAVNKSVQLGRFAVSTTGVGAASQVASGALAKAALQSIKDGINKKNTHQSFGQRVNSHLANRIKKEKDNERE